MIQINYSDKISPFPKVVEGVGRIKSPTLRSIFDITVEEYQIYLTYIRMTPEMYLKTINTTNENLINFVKSSPSIYPIIVGDEDSAVFYCKILEFFLDNQVTYNNRTKTFDIKYNDKPFGHINHDNFNAVSDAIAKMNSISVKESIDNLKFKNDKARELYLFLKVNNPEKSTKEDPNMVVENIVSSVCAMHNSYNMINIWDLTICQLYDQFLKLCINVPFLINAVRWAAWGEKEYIYDVWYRKPE